MINRLIDKLQGDRIIWLIVLLLSLFSVLAVYSSTGTLAYKYQSGNTEYYLLKHLAIMLMALGLMFFTHLIDYKYFSRVAQILLFLSVPLLIFTLFIGTDLNDAKRWITLPVINMSFQTSDFAKLALIMYTARGLSMKQDQIKDFRSAFLPIMVPILVICGLIMPADLSSAALLFVTCLILLFIGRINIKYLFGLMGAGVVMLAILVLIIISLPGKGRVETWKSRIESFTSGGEEQYQVQQAKIAIAKGGFLGRGPGNSTQRNFLPHPYSDFIYAIIIEEYGLVGGAAMVMLYLLFLFRCIQIVVQTPKAFGALLAVGLSLSLVTQALVNMAVTVNLLPVTGLTLPLVSMGGTSLWFTSMAIGIILSVSRSIVKTPAEEKPTLKTA